LYRAQDGRKTSRLGRATSDDGIHFTREARPALVPEAAYEKDGGVEDPRLVKVGSTFYLTYTAYDGKDAQLALATSADLRQWDRRGVIMPANRGRWNVHWTSRARSSRSRWADGTGCTTWPTRPPATTRRASRGRKTSC